MDDNWQRIIFLAVLINFIVAFAISSSYTNTATESEAKELQEVEWFEETSNVSTGK